MKVISTVKGETLNFHGYVITNDKMSVAAPVRERMLLSGPWQQCNMGFLWVLYNNHIHFIKSKKLVIPKII